MWVRSQNKERLMKCEEFMVSKGIGNFANKYSIYTIGIVHLGAYSTREKALKVLDMIQEFINCIEEYKAQGEYKREIVSGCNEIRRLNTFVFQMPQDSEVE